MNKCELCLTEISPDIKNCSQAKYCSKECRLKSRDIRRGRPLKKDRFCLECSVLISSKERRDKLYCSLDCKTKAIARRKLKEVRENFNLENYKPLISNELGIVEIQLAGAKGGVTIIDAKYLKVVLAISSSWSQSTKGYARTRGIIMLHRVIAELEYGIIPIDKEIDHKNRDRLDNRSENLRVATDSQNAANKTIKPNASKYRGVYKNYDKWVAQISINDKVKHLGRYNTPREAALAYNEAAIQAYGEFAVLNQL